MNTGLQPCIELAPLASAPLLARMSRDLVEQGLLWTWRPRRIAALIRNPEVVVLLARDPEKPRNHPDAPLGFAAMHFHEFHAHLVLMAVQPHARRSGIGRRMLTWLESSASHAGIERLTLETRKSNTGGQRFYDSIGFVPIGEVPGYYQGRETAVQMRKLAVGRDTRQANEITRAAMVRMRAD